MGEVHTKQTGVNQQTLLAEGSAALVRVGYKPDGFVWERMLDYDENYGKNVKKCAEEDVTLDPRTRPAQNHTGQPYGAGFRK